MTRRPVMVVVLTLTALSGYFLWSYSSVREGFDPDNDFANWQPTSELVQKALPNGDRGAREQAFKLLFEKRFRKHDPAKAIGIHFDKDGTIHLLTPARLEPWNIDRIALMLHRETQQDFNKAYSIEIYETFIGMPPIKIGEAQMSPKTPQQVDVRYNYPPGSALVVKRPLRSGRARSFREGRVLPAGLTSQAIQAP